MPAPPQIPGQADRTLAAIRQLVEEVPSEALDPRAIQFKHRGIQPPASLYIEQSDQLQIQVMPATASLSLNVNARVLLAAGNIVTFRFDVSSPTTFTRNTTIGQLCEGFLLDVCVNITSGTVRRGECYVVVGLQRSGLSSIPADTVLVADYVSSTSPAAWPGGQIRSSADGPGFPVSLVGSVPAAGAEVTFTVPTGTRLRVRGFLTTFVASATVATRNFRLSIDDGTNIMCEMMTAGGNTVTAGQTAVISGGAGIISISTPYAHLDLSFLNDLVMLAGWRLNTITGNIQVGDQYAALRIIGEQWLEV